MTRAWGERGSGVPCPKHLLPTVITQSGLQHVCVQSDCDFSVRLHGPPREDRVMTKEEREKQIQEFVKNRKAQTNSKQTDVTPAKKPVMKIPPELNATSGKSKKQLRRENEAKRGDVETKTDGDIRKKADKELDAAIKPKKKEKDPNMLSVSQIATELGVDPKRARAKLRSAVEKEELTGDLADGAREGRWPLVKRDSKEHKALVALLKPKAVVADDEDEDDEEAEDDEDEGDEEEDDEDEDDE